MFQKSYWEEQRSVPVAPPSPAVPQDPVLPSAPTLGASYPISQTKRTFHSSSCLPSPRHAQSHPRPMAKPPPAGLARCFRATR